jgi:hypothetical protein
VIFHTIAEIIMTTLIDITNGPTQPSVDGEIIVLGLLAVVLVFVDRGLVELEDGICDVCPLAARLFHVTLYPLTYPAQ